MHSTREPPRQQADQAPNGQSAGWYRVPNALFDALEEIGHAGLTVYNYLAKLANDGESYPSARTIRRVCQISESTRIRATTQLERLGFLTVVRGGGRTSSRYTLPHLSSGVTSEGPAVSPRKDLQCRDERASGTAREGPEVSPEKNNPDPHIQRDPSKEDDHLVSEDEARKKDLLAWCSRKFRGGASPLISPRERVERTDRELLLKLGVLVLDGDLPEAAVDYGLEAIKHHNSDPATGGRPIENRLAYLTTCLHQRLGGKDPHEGKKRLDSLLARVELPAELLKPNRPPEEDAA